MSGLPLISRRRLLTAMALSPLLWQMNTAHAAAIDPNRIVALEWLPVELLLALGIVPYGVADTNFCSGSWERAVRRRTARTRAQSSLIPNGLTI